jgi:hypothetical protein
MAAASKDALAVDALTVVADAGYSNGKDAAACESEGITPCVPANRSQECWRSFGALVCGQAPFPKFKKGL